VKNDGVAAAIDLKAQVEGAGAIGEDADVEASFPAVGHPAHLRSLGVPAPPILEPRCPAVKGAKWSGVALEAANAGCRRGGLAAGAAKTALTRGISVWRLITRFFEHTIFSRVLYQLSYLAWDAPAGAALGEG
jgi:hypothetical protein